MLRFIVLRYVRVHEPHGSFATKVKRQIGIEAVVEFLLNVENKYLVTNLAK